MYVSQEDTNGKEVSVIDGRSQRTLLKGIQIDGCRCQARRCTPVHDLSISPCRPGGRPRSPPGTDEGTEAQREGVTHPRTCDMAGSSRVTISSPLCPTLGLGW